MDRAKLTESYQRALGEIIEEAKKFDDLWDARPDTEISIISKVIDQDACLRVDLQRKGCDYGFSFGGSGSPFESGGDLRAPKEAARGISSATPHGRFSPEEWVDIFYEGLNKKLGEYLAEKEIARRR